MPQSENEYLVSCFNDRLVPPTLSSDAESKLLRQIEANFSVLLKPWLNTCGFAKEQINFLEIGCGDGKYGYFASSHVANYTGIDLREVAIEKATALLSALGNCQVLVGNGLEYAGVSDGSQQLVFSYQTFVHMPDNYVILANLREVVRVLASEGEARIQLLGPAFKQGWRLVWRKLNTMVVGRQNSGLIGRLIHLAGKILPGDFLIPTLRRKAYESHWGKFGASLNPVEAQEFIRSLGANAWVTPSCYGSRYAGYDYAIYWLVIAKGRSELPFFLTLD